MGREPLPSVPKDSVWSYFKRPFARVASVVVIGVIGWWRYEASQPKVHIEPPVRVVDVPPGALLGPRAPEPEWDGGAGIDAEVDPARVRVRFGDRSGVLVHGKFVPDGTDGGGNAGH